MRESLASIAAVATGLVIVLTVVLFATIQERRGSVSAGREVPATTIPDTITGRTQASSAVGEVSADLALGERVYDEQGCAACHSIAGVGSPRAPLDGVGSRLTTEEIELWIVDPQAARPGVRKPAYDRLPPEELEALVEFIRSLR